MLKNTFLKNTFLTGYVQRKTPMFSSRQFANEINFICGAIRRNLRKRGEFPSGKFGMRDVAHSAGI